MSLAEECVAAWGVWDEALLYLALMVDEQEMRLVVALGDRAVTMDEAAALLGMAPAEAEALLQRAYRRHVANRSTEDGVTRYTAARFQDRLNDFAKYGAWDDLPEPARRALDRRFRQDFADRHRANVERKMRGLEVERALPNDVVLLLAEAEAMIDAAEHVVVQPCDCRRLGQNCDRPVETCIWLDGAALDAMDRGEGRPISRDEARALVRRADKAGLMHTAGEDWDRPGPHVICNCCACDCYPFRTALELGSKGAWPRSRYVAAYDVAACNRCGTCVKRCHFAAFYHDGTEVEVKGKAKKGVACDPARCWGCGLCANTCPNGAITMVSLTAGRVAGA